VWKKSESIKCHLRSVVKNDKALEIFEEENMSVDFSTPSSAEDYKGFKFIVDFFIDETEHRYKVYNWVGASISKVLKLSLSYD
jgi:hypothetical protein